MSRCARACWKTRSAFCATRQPPGAGRRATRRGQGEHGEIKMNKQLHLVGNVVEILDLKPSASNGRVETSPDRAGVGQAPLDASSDLASLSKEDLVDDPHKRSLTHARLLDLHLPRTRKQEGGGGGRQRRPRLAATGQAVVLKTTTGRPSFCRHRPGRRRCARFFFSRSAFPFVLLRDASRRSPRESDAKPSQTAVVCVRARARV